MTYIKETNINSPLTAFGEVGTAENQAYIQASPYYEFLPTNFRSYTSGAAGTDASIDTRMFSVSSGTTAGGYGAIQSFRSLNYKPGQGGLARFTAMFPTNAANHWSGVGLVNLSDELSFGYDGTTFGIWHRRNGVAECRTITVTGTGLGNLTLTLNSVAYTIALSNSTTATNAYEIATWLNANQSVWYAEQVDSTVIIIAESDGAKSGTYTFSHATATGSIAQNKAGETKTSTHYPQADWNRNTMPSLDPSKGNVYQINYQYLGFGAIFFSVENPETGRFELVHVIEYSNANTTTSLRQPSLRFGLYSANTTGTTNVTVKCASAACYVQGAINKTRNPRAVKHTQSVSTTLTNVVTLKNRKMYNYIMNQVEIQPVSISIASESSKNTEIELRTNPTLTGATNYTNAGTNLVSDYSTVNNTVSGGTLIASFTLAPGQSQTINLVDYEIALPPSLILSIAAKVNSGAAANVTASITYYEDL